MGNNALSFASGFLQGLSPVLLGELRENKRRKDLERAAQIKNDADIYRQGQENYRANLKIKAEAKAKADEYDNKRRAAVLDWKNKNLQKGIDRDIATDRNASNERVARIRNKKPLAGGNTNYYQGYGSGYTESDAQVFDKMANDAIKSASTGKVIGPDVVGDTKEPNRQLAAKFRAMAQAVRGKEKPTAAEQKVINEYLNFTPQAAKLEPYNGAGPSTNELSQTPVQEQVAVPPELNDAVIKFLGVPPDQALEAWNRLPASHKKLIIRTLQLQQQQATTQQTAMLQPQVLQQPPAQGLQAPVITVPQQQMPQPQATGNQKKINPW